MDHGVAYDYPVPLAWGHTTSCCSTRQDVKAFIP